MNNIKYLSIFLPFLLLSCGPSNEDKLTIRKGKITVAVDEAFKYIAQAEINAYKIHYPETEFETLFIPEQKAINLLLSDSVELAIVSRELNEKEQQYFTNREMKYLPGHLALDAVALIVNKNYQGDYVTLAQVEGILKNTSEKKQKLVFDNANSSNLNLLTSFYNMDKPDLTNVFSANGTENVFDYIEKNENAIGVVGMNWMSDSNDKRARDLKARIKILAVEDSKGEKLNPSLYNLRNKSYPFVKTILLHTTQDRWGVAKGFVRFACSQIGQLVVEKMELQPYYLIPKKYNMTQTAPIEVVK